MKKHEAPENQQHLFDTEIFAFTRKLPTYDKYTIEDIRGLPKNGYGSVVTLIMTKNGNRKKTLYTATFACELTDWGYKLFSTKNKWSTSLGEHFQKMEAIETTYHGDARDKPSYKKELQENKNRFPEYWL